MRGREQDDDARSVATMLQMASYTVIPVRQSLFGQTILPLRDELRKSERYPSRLDFVAYQSHFMIGDRFIIEGWGLPSWDMISDVASERIQAFEFLRRCSDGTRRTAYIDYMPTKVLTYRGVAYYNLFAVRNRKKPRLESAFCNVVGHEKYRDVFDALESVVYVFKQNGKLAWWNYASGFREGVLQRMYRDEPLF